MCDERWKMPRRTRPRLLVLPPVWRWVYHLRRMQRCLRVLHSSSCVRRCLQADRDRLRDQIASLQTQLNEAEATATKLRANVAALEQSKASDRRKAEDKVLEMAATLSKCKHDVKVARDANERLEARIADLRNHDDTRSHEVINARALAEQAAEGLRSELKVRVSAVWTFAALLRCS